MSEFDVNAGAGSDYLAMNKANVMSDTNIKMGGGDDFLIIGPLQSLFR